MSHALADVEQDVNGDIEQDVDGDGQAQRYESLVQGSARPVDAARKPEWDAVVEQSEVAE